MSIPYPPPTIPIPPLPSPLPRDIADLSPLFDGYIALHAQASATLASWEQAVATIDLYTEILGQRIQEVLLP